MCLLTKLRALARRHRPRVWLLWAVGAIALIAVGLTVADPVIWLFVLDPELLALMAVVALASARGAVADAVLRLRVAVRIALRRRGAGDQRTGFGRRGRSS